MPSVLPCRPNWQAHLTRMDSQFGSGGRGAAPKCSNQTNLQLALPDLFHAPDLPQRPSPTFMSLVCIQMALLGPPCRPRALVNGVRTYGFQ